jgi:hypothetical protein
MSEDPRLRPIPGAMNGDKPNNFGPYISDDTLNSEYALERSVEKSLNNDVDVKFPRKAICLYAEEYNEEPLDTYTPIWNVSTYALGYNNRKRIRIKAYDDLLDACLTIPNVGLPEDEWTDQEKATMNLVPWYYLDNDADIELSMPSIGDVVIIDYFDRENLKGGRFLSVHERINITPLLGGALRSGVSAFNDALSKMETLAGKDPGAMAETPPYTPVDDLCEGPVMTKGDIFGGGTVETVVIDGCPVAKDVAGYYMTMKNAAYNDGVTLKINSAFRGYEDVIIPDECGNGSKSGQNSLYEDLGPYVAAPPGTSQHQNGIAFDIQTGMPKDMKPHPDLVTREYKWLIENAHEYGFIRVLSGERWHFEYHPGAGQFSKVAKDHPSWDDQFVG